MPSENDIQQVSGVIGVTREQAQLLLKKFHDPEKAVNAYFDDPEKALQEDKPGWDEAPPYHESDIPYGPENFESAMYAGAPSRPPSRNDSSRSLVDLTHDNAPPGPPPGMSKEDQDFQLAMANSMSDMPGGQQSGVTGIGQQFGPANRDYYDQESWAMVPTSAAREVITQQLPADRQRKPGEPAFLRPSPYKDRLPSLLTIYHSIPLARQTLLLKDVTTPRYGHDSQWWNGQLIHVPKVIAVGENRDYEDVIFEVQRLMAFLDSTKRAYGTSDALASIDRYRFRQSETELTKFFESWEQSAMQAQGRNRPSKTFSSTALKHEEGGTDRGAKKDFYCLEPPVEDEKSMYDVLDRVIWNDGPECLDTGFEDTFIAHLGEVFTAQFTSRSTNKSGCGLNIPSVWYPDRYLSEFRKDALEMRRRAQLQHQNVDKIQRQIDQILKHKLSSGKFVDAKEVLLKAAAAAESVGKNKIPNGLDQELVTLDDEKDSSAADIAKCASELRAIVERIDQKVEALNIEKQKALDVYDEVLKEFTEPSSTHSKQPTHRYTLRGLSTLPHITYFRHPPNGDFEAPNVNPDEWDWWRVSFSKEDGQIQQQEKKNASQNQDTEQSLAVDQPGLTASQLLSRSDSGDVMGYTLKKVTEEEVLRAAQEESKSVLVVYASDIAAKFPVLPVDPHLQAFVNVDNETFTAELKGEDTSGDFEMISNKSSATLANEEYRDDADDDLEPLMGNRPASSMSPQSVGPPAYRRGGDDEEEDDDHRRSPKRSKGIDSRMSMSPTREKSNASSVKSAENTPIEKAGTEHVEYAK